MPLAPARRVFPEADSSPKHHVPHNPQRFRSADMVFFDNVFSSACQVLPNPSLRYVPAFAECKVDF